jgi:hypothetical protein
LSVLANTTALMRSDTAALFGRTYSRRAHEYSTEWPQHAGSAGPRRGAHRTVQQRAGSAGPRRGAHRTVPQRAGSVGPRRSAHRTVPQRAGLCWPATLVCSVSRTISWRGDRTGTVEAGQSGAGRTVIPPSVTVLSALSPPPALISEGLCLLYFLLSVKCSVQNAAAFFDFPPLICASLTS